MDDYTGSRIKHEILDLIEKSRRMRTKLDEDFLEYQSRVEFEFSSLAKETRAAKSRISATTLSSTSVTSASFSAEDEGVDNASWREESSASFSTSFLKDETSTTNEDMDSSLADDESQETAMNHYNTFQARKRIQRQIRFSKSNMMRVKTLNNLSILYKSISGSSNHGKYAVDPAVIRQHSTDTILPID